MRRTRGHAVTIRGMGGTDFRNPRGALRFPDGSIPRDNWPGKRRTEQTQAEEALKETRRGKPAFWSGAG